MDKIFTSPLFGLVLSMGVYVLMTKVQKILKSDLFNPLLMSSIFIIAFLMIFNISYESYNIGGQFISALIGPATVALAIPLYMNLGMLAIYKRVILVSISAGVLAHAITIGVLASVLKLSPQMIATVIPKSVTTAIAADVAVSLGGISTLTVCIVIITGIFGAALAPLLNKIFRIDSPIAQGLALGTAAHAVGTSKAIEMGKEQGIMSTLALILTGIFTVIISPITKIIIFGLLGI